MLNITGEGVHVITSGKDAAGRNFEIGQHSEEEIQRMYPEEMNPHEDEVRRHFGHVLVAMLTIFQHFC